MHRFLLAAGFAAATSVLSTTAAAEPVTVVTSIKPLHSLVSGVMQGAGSPHLIVEGGASPHAYSLKPSDARALQEARVMVWIGEGLETFLATSIASLAADAEVIELAEVPGLTLLPYREGGPWDAHAHEDEHHADEHHEDEHGHDEHEHHEHGHDEHGHEEHAHEEHGHEEHGHGETDMHLWLDPDNARVIVDAVARALIKADPENSTIYLANVRIMDYRLTQLAEEIEHDLAPVKDKPFVVFHDAFQYFDARFGLNTVGSVTVDPERKPGAARLQEIRHRIAELGARCVFAEPQFEPRLLEVVVEGTAAKIGQLDPLGADLTDGPELYFELMRQNATALKDCLGETS